MTYKISHPTLFYVTYCHVFLTPLPKKSARILWKDVTQSILESLISLNLLSVSHSPIGYNKTHLPKTSTPIDSNVSRNVNNSDFSDISSVLSFDDSEPSTATKLDEFRKKLIDSSIPVNVSVFISILLDREKWDAIFQLLN